MQARCPHCSNVFSTERAGIQFCPNCGQQINVPDPSAAGAPPPPPGAPGAPGMPPGGPGTSAFTRGPVPWEERSQRGLVAAFIENWKMVITQPEQFWSRLQPAASLVDALFFSWICFGLNLLINFPIQMANAARGREAMEQVIQQAKNLPPEAREIFRRVMEFFLGGGAAWFVVGEIIIYPVIMIIVAAFTHLFCLIFGVSKNGFNATARVVGYAQAPYLFGWLAALFRLIPIAGPMFSGLISLGLAVYGTVLLIWGLARAQDSTTGRATAAVLVPWVVLCCCCVGGVIFAVAAAAQGAAANAQ